MSLSTSQQFTNGVINHVDERSLRVSIIDIRNDTRIIHFISLHPGSLIYHHPAWLTALQEESGQRCLMMACESEDGSLWGIMPLAYTRGLPFNVFGHQTKRRISSLPRTPFAGPISLIPKATDLLLAAALEEAETEKVQLQIKSASLLPQGDHDKFVCTKWRPTYVLALPQSPDQLAFGNAKIRHNIKWGLKKARKLGLSVRSAETDSELRAWYDLYLITMRRNFVPPRSYKFFLSLWNDLRKSHSMRLLIAEQTSNQGTRLVAGSIFLMTGKTVFYAFTGCSSEHLSTHANDMILWEAIHNASQDGYGFFDFGEVPEEHPELVRFKTKWGSVPKPLYRYYYPHPGHSALHSRPNWFRQALCQVWQHVPLSITASVGEWICNYL